METRSIFDNLSPLDHRYFQSNKKLFTELGNVLSENAAVRYFARVETALLLTHIRNASGGKVAPELETKLLALADSISAEEVYAEEEKTQHNIRALVNVMKRHVPAEYSHFIHMGATSVDILDTANSLRVRDAVNKVILPQLVGLENELADLAEREKATPQVGRTHGQYAVPITFGFAVAEYVSRLGKSIVRIHELQKDLRGKLAGAVGAYNATSMLTADPEALEREALGQLGLEPSEHSTQMVEPEHLLRLLTEINTAFGVIANLADDFRNLQRSEIDEIREYFSPTQVGSSTMPQKRNPWNSEHVKSLWKAFAPRVMTFFLDQISEHQRDLTNSASGRFVADYLAGFLAAVARMRKVVSGIRVNKDVLQKTLDESAGASVLAEAAYILLSREGESDAHETIRVLTLKAEQEGKSLSEVFKSDVGLWQRLSQGLRDVGVADAESFFSNPSSYSGRAARKAGEIAGRWKRRMQELASVLG